MVIFFCVFLKLFHRFFQNKIYIILTNPLLYPPKTIYFYIYIKNGKPEMIYSIESDDRANKNTEQDFLCCDNLHILSCISFLVIVFFFIKSIFTSTKLVFFVEYCRKLLYMNKRLSLILAMWCISLQKMHKKYFEISSCLCTLSW